MANFYDSYLRMDLGKSILQARSLVASNGDCFEKRPVALTLEDLDLDTTLCPLSKKAKTFL